MMTTTTTFTNRMKLSLVLGPALAATLALTAGTHSTAHADPDDVGTDETAAEDAGTGETAAEDAGTGETAVEELGGDDQPQRRCPNLTTSPEEHYERYMEAVRTVGKSNIPYFSCGEDCKLAERALGKKPLSASEAAKARPQEQRNKRLWSLVGAPHANKIFYGKASSAGFQALADKLVAIGAQNEWNTLAGLDCNGFVYQYAAANGWGWVHENLDPPKFANQPHVQRTVDICPGDIIVYTGAKVRHVAIVGERIGQEVLNQFKDRETGKTETVQLATFRVYESANDGSPKGLQEHVQGFDLNTTENFRLFHHKQKDRTQWNWAVVVPGPGSL